MGPRDGALARSARIVADSGAFLDVRGAAKAFGPAVVLDGVDLAVARGEFVSLLGPSGCGKTTLLRVVAGLLRADAGRVTLDGEDLSDRPPHRRGVGVCGVFTYEVAETKVTQVMDLARQNQHPLQCTIEKD